MVLVRDHRRIVADVPVMEGIGVLSGKGLIIPIADEDTVFTPFGKSPNDPVRTPLFSRENPNILDKKGYILILGNRNLPSGGNIAAQSGIA